MNAVIKSIEPDSPASKTIIAPGDTLRRIDGSTICDVLDYKFHSYDSRLFIELMGVDGKLKLVRLKKPEGADLGLEFESPLMDEQRSCANKCVFCFIDQLPDNMRETLYYKDDDMRLSFLQGNYITLTNLSQRDVDRVIKMRISPINVSVHTLDPELRNHMLGTKRAAEGIRILKAFATAGIMLNCQIVCCPGINDGEQLTQTIEGLIALGDAVNSVSIVPVGLTKHRQGLAELRPFDKALAQSVVQTVECFAAQCLKSRGSRVFFCGDELYIKAGLDLPSDEDYEDYPQLQNGVGMMRLLIEEFETALTDSPKLQSNEPFTIVTGSAAFEYLTNLLKSATAKYDNINGKVREIRNDFFGDSVTVSGLITGRDIIGQLQGRGIGTRLLIPCNMLRHGGDVFLDDVTVEELGESLGVTVRVVEQDGADLLSAILGDC